MRLERCWRPLISLDTGQYDLRRLHDALQHDVDSLTELWRLIGRHYTRL